MTRQVSPARPQPVSGLMASARVYMTVSRSGEMWSPWRSVSSPVLTTAVISPGGTHLDHAPEQPGGAHAAGQGGDHRAISPVGSRSDGVVARLPDGRHQFGAMGRLPVPTWPRRPTGGCARLPACRRSDQRPSDPDRLSVGFDATPLLGRPTGVGVFCAGALAGLAGRRRPSTCRPSPSAGADARASPPWSRPGSSHRQRAMPARPLHAAWAQLVAARRWSGSSAARTSSTGPTSWSRPPRRARPGGDRPRPDRRPLSRSCATPPPWPSRP